MMCFYGFSHLPLLPDYDVAHDAQREKLADSESGGALVGRGDFQEVYPFQGGRCSHGQGCLGSDDGRAGCGKNMQN